MPPLRYKVRISSKTPPCFAAGVVPEQGQVLALIAVVTVKSVREEQLEVGGPFREVVLEALEYDIRQTLEDTPPLKAEAEA